MARTENATEKMKRDALIAAAARQGAPILCAICGLPILPGQRYALDHGHAVGRDGPNTVANLFPVHDEKEGELACHLKKTAHPRGPHTAIGGDTFEAAKTGRLADKFVPNKRPLDTVFAGEPGRCRGCGQYPSECQCTPRVKRPAFWGGR